MYSSSFTRFQVALTEALILRSFVNQNVAGTYQLTAINQACLKASVANGVGCWEGYIEAVLQEFVAKTRVNAQSKTWTLIAQFEIMVKKQTDNLNTPNWDKTRELILHITGIDPYTSWIWKKKFQNQNMTKDFFDGVMNVRHAFAHGFSVPNNVPGLLTPGELDSAYVDDALACLTFFAEVTDNLLEHELNHRHSCRSGWK